MQILPKRKVITQADWNELVKTAAANQNDLELEITSERATIMTMVKLSLMKNMKNMKISIFRWIKYLY